MGTGRDAEDVLDDLVRWLRQEAASLIMSGANYKIVIHGSAGGQVRAVVEKHMEVLPAPARRVSPTGKGEYPTLA